MRYPIRGTAFAALLTRLGITPPPQQAFELESTVVPISLVDSDITLSAAALEPLYGNPASAGELVAPAAGTRLADTGALAAGNYSFFVIFTAVEGNSYRIRRRNAADAADVWSIRATLNGVAGLFEQLKFRVALANNERLVVENVVAGGVGNTYQASIFAVAG